MESPYRRAAGSEMLERASSRGLVDEVVSQFADSFAFLRELVQNAIDAGSPTVDVEISHDPDARLARVVVRDRGEGMDRELLEGSLLVLFRSTKDQDVSKIGKFGIGFASVLAARPNIVIVETSRGGQRYTLHLSPDLSYQIFEPGPSTRTGTSVELEIPIAGLAFTQFVARCHDALRRWCRHTLVPIRLLLRRWHTGELHNESLLPQLGHGHVGEDGRFEVRIDAPLGLDDVVVQVHGVSADGCTEAVVGLVQKDQVRASFYNRGLLLYESTVSLVPGVTFKVLDARLGHTLSRDDVRRDDVFHQAMELVRQLAERDLPAALADELARAAASDGARWRELFDAVDAAGLTLTADQWSFPLAAPLAGALAQRASALPRRVWATAAQTPLVEALAAAGLPVLGPLAPALHGAVERRSRRELRIVEHELTLVELAPMDAADTALLAALSALLAHAHRAPRELWLASFQGAFAAAAWVTGGPRQALVVLDERRWVIEPAQASASAFSRWGSRSIALNVGARLIDAARRRSLAEPLQAAALLARAILLQQEELDEAASLRLLEYTLERLALGEEPA